MTRDPDMKKDIEQQMGPRRASVTLFASPEAAAAIAELESGEDFANRGGDRNEDDSEGGGIDIPLAPSADNVKKKATDLDDIVRSYSTPGKPVTTTIPRSRWRKLKICASLCANLEKDLKNKSVKPSSENNSLNTHRFNNSPPSKNIVRSRSLSPRPPKQLAVGSTKTQNEILGDCLEDNILDHNGNIARTTNDSIPVLSVDHFKNDDVEHTENDHNNDIPEETRSEGGEDLRDSSESLPNKLLQFSKSSRFGRRLSLPPCLPSSAGQNQLLPAPPSPRSHVSSNGCPVISPRRAWSINGQSTSSTSGSEQNLNLSKNQDRHLSINSNLEVNRTIVSKLIQERSSVISKLNLSNDTITSKKEDAVESPRSPQKTDTPESGSPRSAVPLRSRLLDRRASLGCAASLHEFNERRNAAMTRPKKAASVDSILPLRSRNSLPSSKAEVTKYFALCDFKRDDVSLHSGQTVPSTSSADSGYVSRAHSGSLESVFTEKTPSSPMRPQGRRESMPCIRDPKFIGRQVADGTGRRRSDAEIVLDIEDEIQQRISKRKQQLVEQAGGVGYHTRLQDRARARSTGGRLKQALKEMNSTRTTAELMQMASKRKSTATK